MVSVNAVGNDLERLTLYIDGQFVDGEGDERIVSIDPATGSPWATVPNASDAEVDRAVAAARRAFEGPWGRKTGPERAAVMRRFARLVEANVDRLARVETRDNGKLLRETTGAVSMIPRWFDYFAGAAERLGGDTLPAANPNYFVYSVPEPVGVVAAIVPWNGPLMIFTMKVAPALAAGCTVVVKTAEQTTASALELMRLTAEAGFPDGVINVVTGTGATTGRALVRHPGVDKVSFTGSTPSGIQVMKDAADHVAPVTLELGGKSANVVFADADLDAAANGVIASVFAATGQMCIAAGRLLVERSVRDELLERVVARARTIRLGNPTDPETEMGPLATREQRDRVEQLMAAARDEGATVVCGGARPEGEATADGYFFPPTVLTDVDPDMRIAREEVFGPVLAVFAFDTEEEAIRLANDTQYGLAGGVWTTNLQRAMRVSKAVRAGSIWVNSYRVSDPAVPFGGMKASGFGRENGEEAVREFTETKSVWIELSGVQRDPFLLGA